MNTEKSTGLKVREWTTSDIPAIQRVLWETWLDAYSRIVPVNDLDTYFKEHYSPHCIEALIDSPTVRGFVAEVHGEVAGIAKTAHDAKAGKLFLTSLYVLPAHQGKGIGTALLNEAENEARSHGLDRIWLGVMEQNTPTLDWYMRIGFKFVQRAPFDVGKTTVPHLIGYRTIQH